MANKLILWIGFVGLAITSYSQPIHLTADGRVSPEGQLVYYRDLADTLSIHSTKYVAWQSLPKNESPNFGFDRTSYWFKLAITNTSLHEDWLLEVNFPLLDHIDFYIEDSTSTSFHKQVAGDAFPISARNVYNRHPIFTFSIPQTATRSIYIHVKTTSSVQLPLTFWSEPAFATASYTIQVANGLFYGAMLVMALYQLFLFFSLRDRITFYYVITLIAMTNVVALFQGYTFLYLYPEHPNLNSIMAVLTGPFFIIISTLLTREFLRLREFSKVLDNLLLVNVLLDVLVGAGMLVFPNQVSYKYHHYFMLSHCLLALASAGYCLYKQYKPARYYLLSWVTVLLATSMFTIGNLGFVPGYLATNNSGLMIGCVLQTLFIAFALGDRWRTMERENQQVKDSALKKEQEENERLEHEVRLRTQEIRQQHVQLEEVMHVKDKLFSVVSHDLKGPLSSLHLALTLAKTGTLSASEFQQISAGLEQRLSQTTEFIDNLLQWAKLQMRGETFTPELIDLSWVVHEILRMLEQECKQKSVILHNNVRESCDVYADLTMTKSILRNLISNAIKFTKAGGTITIDTYTIEQKIIISVSDTGVGISPVNQERLFTVNSVSTKGTSLEKGTGLGLLLCKEFVEKNGGRIWFESKEGVGTTFYFSLPEYAASKETAVVL